MAVGSKRGLDNKGFGALGVLAVIVVLAVAGGASVYVYHHNHKTKAKMVASTSSTTSKTSGKSATSTTTAKANPYAGWKTYTDATYHYSFKYPTDWALTTAATQGVSVSVRNPGNSVLVSYANPFVKDSGTTTFSTVAVGNTSPSSSLKVVGGFDTSNYLPTYAVVDAGLLQTYPLTVGQTSTFVTTPSYADSSSTGSYAQLTAYPVGKVFTTAAQAQAWFDTSNAKTSLLILKSLTYTN